MITRRPMRRSFLNERRGLPLRRSSMLSEKATPSTPSSILHEQFQVELKNLTEDSKVSSSRKKMINDVMKNEEIHFKSLLETVTYGDVGTTVTYAIPVVKKMLAELILPNIVDTQALDMPQGFIRFLKPKKTLTKGVDTLNEELPRQQITQPNDEAMAAAAAGGLKNTYSPYYSAGIMSVAMQIQVTTAAQGDCTVTFEKNGYNRALIQDEAASGATVAMTADTSSVLLYDETAGTWAELTSSSSLTNAATMSVSGLSGTIGGYLKDSADTLDYAAIALPGVTVVDGAAATVQAYLMLTITAATGAIASAQINEGLDYTTNRDASAVLTDGDFLSISVLLPYELEDSTLSNVFSGVEFDITFLPIYTTPRYLNAKLTAYSLLAGQKMGINPDQELLDYNAAAMAVEIDRWGISQLRKAALVDSNVPLRTYDATAATPTGGIYTDASSYYSHILRTLIGQRNDIYKAAFRGKGNFMVTSTEVSAIFETLNKLEPVNMEGDKIAYAGKLAGMWETYIDPYYVENEVLMGYASGKNDMKAGAVYAPFIPMYLTPPDYKGDTFQFVYGIVSSAGFRVYDNDNYGVTTVTL